MTIDQSQRPRKFDLPVAEQGFIGALLICPKRTGEVGALIQPDDILTPTVKNIYVAMLSLWSRGIEPEAEMIADELQAHDLLEGIGGRSALVRLMTGTASPDPGRYIPAILEQSLRRRVTTRLRQALEAGSNPSLTGSDILDLAKELLDGIDVPTQCPSEAVPMPVFCAGEDTYDWLVPDLIERGDRVLIVAAEGQGKSMMARQIAVCCALGIHPFGGDPYDPMRVLFLDLENPISLGRRKLRPMYATARRQRPQGNHDNLSIICRPGGLDVTSRSDARWLTSQLTQARPDLVVLGPLYKMSSGGDNWEREAAKVSALLDDLRARLSFGLIMETHAPQGSNGVRHLRPLGSSLWLRWPEFIITFAATERDPNTVEVSTTKGRDTRYWPAFLRRGGAGEWPWMVSSEPPPAGQKGKRTPLVAPSEPPPSEPPPEYDEPEEMF